MRLRFMFPVALVVVLAGGCAAPVRGQVRERADLGRFFREAGMEGAFILLDVAKGEYQVYNPARAERRVLPASTFKILNSLIALETKAVADPDVVIEWDGVDRANPAWNQDHTMRSAFPVSAVWFYQELARRVGEERMQEHVRAVGYGNGDVGGGIDRFWLYGALRISPREQVDFLARLHRGDLPFAPRTIDLVKEVMVVERTDGYVLRAKTGWADATDPGTGWYVGYVERDGNAYAFATQVDMETVADAPKRIAITRRILAEMGLVERPPTTDR